MRLDELTAGMAAEAAGEFGVGAELEIAGLAYDSRAVHDGDLFFCVSGFQRDGHEFAPRAIEAGAVALIVERHLGLAVPEVLVSSARAAMAPVAARFYGDPSAALQVLGVTGTNGKTTTAYLLRALLEAGGDRCALLGTVKSVIAGKERAVARTTPEAIDLQADFRAMLDGGDRACAIEVSSHALELGRAEATHFAAAIFTNLTQDHLDFHETMEDYFLAKRRLFFEHGPRASIVNVADRYGRRLAEELRQADEGPPGAGGERGPRRGTGAPCCDTRTFAVEAPADYSATALNCDYSGCSFTLEVAAGEHGDALRRELRLPMPGRFNVANALAALAAAHAIGGELELLLAALERGVHVPGRFEPVEQGQDFAVLVDYAHTPDSLENVLGAARELIAAGEAEQGRVVCVFGAGGDRDRGKRPLMGEIAARLADVTLITSDNPRSEDPEQIIAEIMAGVARVKSDPDSTGPAPVRSIADRAVAIDQAIAQARRGDIVVIAGKGHEQGQEFAGGRKLPFDDVDVAGKALRLRQARV